MVVQLTAPAHGGGWPRVIAGRLLRLAVLLLGIAIAAFALAKLSPVDPVDAYLGGAMIGVGPEQRAAIAERLHLYDGVASQFAAWLRNIISCDLGISTIYNQPVATVIAERALPSLALTGTAWILSGLLGFALGLVAGAREGSWLDRVIRVYCYVLASTPTFWIAIVLLIVFAFKLGWAPFCCVAPPGLATDDITLTERLRHLALPLTAVTLLGVAQVALHTRIKVIEIMRSDYVTFAFAQGATRLDVLLRHAARNAALPAITIQFASLGELFGGSALAEQVFSYPALGKATVDAGLRGDVPLLLALALLTAAFVSTGNTIADLLYRVVDPRTARAEALP